MTKTATTTEFVPTRCATCGEIVIPTMRPAGYDPCIDGPLLAHMTALPADRHQPVIAR